MERERSSDLLVSIVAGVCVLGLAVVSKYAIERELDFVSQYGPVWIYIAYMICSPRDGEPSRPRTLLWSLSIAAATLGIILVYALG